METIKESFYGQFRINMLLIVYYQSTKGFKWKY